MRCDFEVGDEVVCTNHTVPDGFQIDPDANVPEIGEVDIVAKLIPVPPGYVDQGVCVVLRRRRAASAGPDEGGYPHWWFRKVEKPKRSTDIEVFRRIDRDVFGKITEDA